MTHYLRAKQGQFWFVITFFLFLSAGFAGSQPLAFEGQFECRFVLGLNEPRLEQSIKFQGQIDVEKQEWRIDDLTNPPRIAFTFRDILLARNVFKENVKIQFEVSSYVDDYPMDLDSDQRLIWFVYCARDYLKLRSGKQLTMPHGDARSDLEMHACYAEILWRSDKDICPSQVTFVYSNALLRQAVQQMTLEPGGSYLNEREKRLQSLSAMCTNGTILARFQVTSWTNSGASGIPENWKMVMLVNEMPMRVYQGSTTRVGTIDRVTLPSLPSVVEIRDKRVRSVGQGVNLVTYSVTNGNIPDTQDRSVRLLVAKASSPNNTLMPPNLRKPRVFVIGGLIILLLAPIGVSWARSRRKRAS